MSAPFCASYRFSTSFDLAREAALVFLEGYLRSSSRPQCGLFARRSAWVYRQLPFVIDFEASSLNASLRKSFVSSLSLETAGIMPSIKGGCPSSPIFLMLPLRGFYEVDKRSCFSLVPFGFFSLLAGTERFYFLPSEKTTSFPGSALARSNLLFHRRPSNP